MFRYPDGALPNCGALSYLFAAYSSGIVCLANRAGGLNMLGIVLVASALCMAAYLIHDCAHNAIFRSTASNARLAVVLGWITGSCYTPTDAIIRKHMLHHKERIDNVSFDYRIALRTRPRLTVLVRILEWCYLPAVELWMRLAVLTAPFRERRFAARRARVLCMLLVRGTLFTMLGMWSPRALGLYVIAYLLFVHVLRFFDAFQHSYALRVVSTMDDVDRAARPPPDYEERNTYSNPLASRWPWLNWLVLNFPFHNAHHHRPHEPWYRLPQIHREYYGDLSARTLCGTQMLRNYHHYRVVRVLDDYGAEGHGIEDPTRFAGALGVSFLTQY